MIDRRLAFGFDYSLLIAAVLISCAGLLALSSVTYNTDHTIFTKQFFWILGGLAAFLIVISIDYHMLAQISGAIFAISLLPLIFLLIFGRSISGAKSWIDLGPFSLQPSEFIKITTLLICAYYLAETIDRGVVLSRIITIGFITGVPFVLIALQPDFGTGLTYIVLFIGMLFFMGTGLRFLIVVTMIFLLMIPVAWFFVFKDYQKARVLTFVNPSIDPKGAGYQIIQSKIAVGSGGVTGKGWKAGSQSQLKFVPEQATDFIFSVLAEEWGLLGSSILLCLYFFVVMRCCDIAAAARDPLGSYIVLGFMSIFVFQVLINIGMIIGLTPTTGLPLPFMSYGGSSMIVNFIGIGLVINVNMRRFVN